MPAEERFTDIAAVGQVTDSLTATTTEQPECPGQPAGDKGQLDRESKYPEGEGIISDPEDLDQNDSESIPKDYYEEDSAHEVLGEGTEGIQDEDTIELDDLKAQIDNEEIPAGYISEDALQPTDPVSNSKIYAKKI
ncbi:hypothetical protein VPNG_06291 [Cytospora leucostoma]|uniref:Uncharacterized protein n=1 Tax=Cytospora leucostoma TaxID=1230097 RepID=A0A423X243_9PEZI|nr:hypothetical protein VPNG_06291 [Cytospora leucostoma]